MAAIEAYETAKGKRYRVRYRTPDRRQTDKRGFRTKRDAEQFLIAIESAKNRGEWIDPSLSRTSVAQWSTTWLAAHSNLKPTTLTGYRWILRKYIVPRWGTTPLVEINHVDVQVWVSGLGKNLAPASVRKVHVVFSGLMKYALRDQRIARNPCDGIRLPRVLKASRGYLNHEQVADLARLSGPSSSIVFFLAYTGLRWGEMAALKVKRVDLERRRVDVAEAVTEPTGTIIWGTPKNHHGRSVPFPSFLNEMLRPL